MKVGMFRTGLTNPAFLAMLGIDAFNAFDEGRTRAAEREALQGNEFTDAALAAGKPVTEEPGGLFRRGVSALTGGLVSPNIEATPHELAQEQLALGKQDEEKFKELSGLAELRKNAGAGIFGHVMSNSPLGRVLAQSGTTAEDWQKPTEGELKEQRAIEHQQKTEEHQTQVENRMERGQQDTERHQQEELGISKARLGLSAAGLRNAQIRMTPEYQAMAAKAHAIGTAEAIPEMPIASFSKVGSFIDPETMDIVKPNAAKNVGEAMAKYPMISAHDLPYFKLAKGAIDAIDRRIELANELLPSTAGMSDTAAQIAVKKNQAKMLWAGASNPDVREWKDTTFANAVQPAVTAMQHRYASAATAHLDAPAFGDSSMSREAAIQNLTRMRNTLKAAYVGGVKAESPSVTTDAISSLPAPDAAVESFDAGGDD